LYPKKRKNKVKLHNIKLTTTNPQTYQQTSHSEREKTKVFPQSFPQVVEKSQKNPIVFHKTIPQAFDYL